MTRSASRKIKQRGFRPNNLINSWMRNIEEVLYVQGISVWGKYKKHDSLVHGRGTTLFCVRGWGGVVPDPSEEVYSKTRN